MKRKRCEWCDELDYLVERVDDNGNTVYLCVECSDVIEHKDNKRMNDK